MCGVNSLRGGAKCVADTHSSPTGDENKKRKGVGGRGSNRFYLAGNEDGIRLSLIE